MKLQFSRQAEASYKHWKSVADDNYRSLRETVLNMLQTPASGPGNPRNVIYEGRQCILRNFGNDCKIVYSLQDDVLRVEFLEESGNVHVHRTSIEQHQSFIDCMKGFLDNGKPKLGIFWYDYRSNVLFGVEKGDAELYVGSGRMATLPKLHKTYWQKMHHRAVASGDVDSVFYGEHDYTRIPRGRIFLENGKYYVNVGDWINGLIDGELCIDSRKLRELIVDEFNLPDDFEFRQDIHWDIGHGWSEECF